MAAGTRGAASLNGMHPPGRARSVQHRAGPRPGRHVCPLSTRIVLSYLTLLAHL
jgi:hypothetical protein